jgi:phospholipase D1/2
MVLHWQQRTISKGGTSLIESLAQYLEAERGKAGVDIGRVEDYIIFCSLRQHALLKGKPVTEMIYVHAKLMIVDDEMVIVGSANINDRSLDGARDSEICVAIEDDHKIATRLAGREVSVGLFGHSLRAKLFKEHFDISEAHYDFLDDDKWKNIVRITQVHHHWLVHNCCRGTLKSIVKYSQQTLMML